MKATLLDNETTGLINNRTMKLDKQPHIIEFYGCSANLKTGKVLKEVNQLVRPPDKRFVTDEISKITGLTWEDLKDAPPMEKVAPKIFKLIEESEIVIAHNLSFDKDMLEIEADRLGKKIKWPKRLICTVEQTIHLKGFRLNLAGLYDLLFNEKFEGAHRAKADVMALLRCCKELVKREIL